MSILEAAVADMLIKATQAAEAAGKFAVEQLPDIAQQYVLYVGVTNTIKALLCIGLVILICYAIKQQVKWVSGWSQRFTYETNERGMSYIITACVVLFGGIPLTGYFFHFVDRAVLAFLAPKILLIQWAAELVK